MRTVASAAAAQLVSHSWTMTPSCRISNNDRTDLRVTSLAEMPAALRRSTSKDNSAVRRIASTPEHHVSYGTATVGMTGGRFRRSVGVEPMVKLFPNCALPGHIKQKKNCKVYRSLGVSGALAKMEDLRALGLRTGKGAARGRIGLGIALSWSDDATV